MSISHTYIGLSSSSFFKDCQISPRFTRGRRPCQWMKAFPSSKALANTAITYTLNTLKMMYEYVKPWTSIIPSSTYGFLKKNVKKNNRKHESPFPQPSRSGPLGPCRTPNKRHCPCPVNSDSTAYWKCATPTSLSAFLMPQTQVHKKQVPC